SPAGRVYRGGVSGSSTGPGSSPDSAIRSTSGWPRCPKTVKRVSLVASARKNRPKTAAAPATTFEPCRRHQERTDRGTDRLGQGAGSTGGCSSGRLANSACRAHAASAASANRFFGTFSISLSSTSASEFGTAGFRLWTAFGRESVTCLRTVNGEEPWNGGTPVSIV